MSHEKQCKRYVMLENKLIKPPQMAHQQQHQQHQQFRCHKIIYLTGVALITMEIKLIPLHWKNNNHMYEM